MSTTDSSLDRVQSLTLESLQPALRERLEAVLEPSEEILWLGQPHVYFPLIIMGAVASLFVGAFCVLGIQQTGSDERVFRVFVFMAFCMWCASLVGAFNKWRQSRWTLYSLTNQRAIGLVPKRRGFKVFSFFPEDTGKLKCWARASGVGALMWSERVPGPLSWLLIYAAAFPEVAGVRRVYELLLDTFSPRLGPMLDDSDPARRRKAALALSNVGDKAITALPALIKGLQSEDAVVRRRCAVALGKLAAAASPSIQALRMLQFDEDASVVNAAVEALAKIEKSESIPR